MILVRGECEPCSWFRNSFNSIFAHILHLTKINQLAKHHTGNVGVLQAQNTIRNKCDEIYIYIYTV